MRCLHPTVLERTVGRELAPEQPTRSIALPGRGTAHDAADLYAQRLVVLTRRGAPIIPFWVGLSSSALSAVQVGC
jgi:hypothetical protein